jgi:2-polyprenyl-6-methoxyphenol hydroxylase-like FAD-dependent oxidoreductase
LTSPIDLPGPRLNLAMAPPKTIAIIGSAIAGPTLALQILSNSVLKSAFRPILFDQAAAPGLEGHNEKNRAGASVGVFANGLYPLYRLGLEDVVRKRGYECGHLTTWSCDYEGGRKRLNSQANAMWSHDIQTGVMYFERRALQSLLVEKVKQLGGDVFWAKKTTGFDHLTNGQTRVNFADGTEVYADLLVGADGGFSSVRKFILEQKNSATAADRWLPDFMGLTGFYAVSAAVKAKEAPAQFSDSHLIWLDKGFLASGPCPDGKIRWDLVLPEKAPPSSSSPVETVPESPTGAERWQPAIIPSQYPYNSTVDILRKHNDVFHPYAGTLESLFGSANRIIRTPLRQRVWAQDEIQHNNVVLVGDAARLMLPTSGQGTGFAIEDATVLARELLKHASAPKSNTIREALEAYANARVPRSKKMAFMAKFAASMSTSDGLFWRGLRYYSSKLQPDRLDAR